MNKAANDIQRVTVMGLGLFGGGVGVAEYWASQGKEVLITDLRDSKTLAPSLEALKKFDNIEYVLGKHREPDFTNTDLLIVNPAVKPNNKFLKLTQQTGIPVTTEIGIFASEHKNRYNGSVLAITGSNGKSTTTSLLASILTTINPNTLSGGNIGGSLLSRLGSYPIGTPAILELSSFQLYHLAKEAFSPDVAIITNLAPNHLDWHTTLENYYYDKKAIITAQAQNSYSILNYEDAELKKWDEFTNSTVFFTAMSDKKFDNLAFIKNNNFIIRHQGKEQVLAKLSSLKLPGKHNLSNALQALTAAYLYLQQTESLDKINKFDSGLSDFTGLAHRQEVIAEIEGILYVNDSIATTPESSIAALNSYGNREIIIIAGGYDKKISLIDMSKEIAHKAKAAILIGQTASILNEQIKGFAPDFDTTLIASDSFEEAIKAASKKTSNGVVLLSPGCASYGMFINFQERGNKFKNIIQRLFNI